VSTLTEQERHRLWEAGDHHPEVCDCGGDDWSAEGQWCGELEETFAAVESIVDARVAAAVVAERERLREKIAELHAPFNIYDECDHEHTDEDVREGKALDIHEVGYTCALSYVSCRECCTDYDGLHYWPTEECADHHEHTLNPDDRCATVALLAAEREGGEE
jgi:hypothetical protein